MQGICKSFGANNVLQDVDFSLKTGEICALLGENGAGKSTLMNILGGVLPADKGVIELDGKPVHFASPVDSLDVGIAFIHQELNLLPERTIAQNIFAHGYIPLVILNMMGTEGYKQVEGTYFIDSGCVLVTKDNMDNFQADLQAVTDQIIEELPVKYLTK